MTVELEWCSLNDVLVVIPVYGQKNYTRKCIDSCIKMSGILHDTLVVDDGSPNPYVQYGMNILRLQENSGFTNAINQGILYAQTRGYKYVMLLNNDTEAKQNFLKILYDHMESNPNIGIASSARLKSDDSFELFGVDLIRGYQMITKKEHITNENLDVNWVPFCSVLLRMDMIREIGLLNKKMRTHSSDLEYCIRAKINGWKVALVMGSRVFHHHEVTTRANKIVPEKDQKVLLEILSGLYYAMFMNDIPLDAEHKTYGQLKFEVVQK